MDMERITIDLPIVRIESGSPMFANDFAEKHYPKGLFIIDNGDLRYMASYDGVYMNSFRCPNDVVEKHLIEKAIRDNDAIYHRDMEAIEERLSQISRLLDSVNAGILSSETRVRDDIEAMRDGLIDKITEKDKENKEDHTSMMNFWHELRLRKELGGGGDNGANVIDIAKAFAVISKPELIKELSK